MDVNPAHVDGQNVDKTMKPEIFTLIITIVTFAVGIMFGYNTPNNIEARKYKKEKETEDRVYSDVD